MLKEAAEIQRMLSWYGEDIERALISIIRRCPSERRFDRMIDEDFDTWGHSANSGPIMIERREREAAVARIVNDFLEDVHKLSREVQKWP